MSDFMFGLVVLCAFCVTGIVVIRFVSRMIAAQIRQIQSGMQTVKKQEQKSEESQTSKPVQAVQATRKFKAAKVVDYSEFDAPSYLRKTVAQA